jgi:enoyl-CoA hydratase/carnithine racemase
MSSPGPVALLRDGAVVTLQLERAEARNALDTATLAALRGHLAALREDPEVFAVVLRGSGTRAFCAGADLKERRTMDEAQVKHFVREIRATMDDIASLPQPTIAAINGSAFGGGCEMALSCDLRLMVEEAFIGLTETSLAIIPGAGGCARLPRLVGAAQAKRMILLAERLSSTEALDCGLVHRLAAQEDFDEALAALLGALLANGPLALQAAKAAIDGGLDLPLEGALEHEAACYQRIIPTEDRLEALAAFAEKRRPVFRGR